MSVCPDIMLAITAPRYTDPSGYELTEIPRPTASGHNDVVFRVHAASINPIDVKLVAGVLKAGLSQMWVAGITNAASETYADEAACRFPLQIGYDCGGVVAEVGSGVKDFKVGDHVWSRLPEATKGMSMYGD